MDIAQFTNNLHLEAPLRSKRAAHKVARRASNFSLPIFLTFSVIKSALISRHKVTSAAFAIVLLGIDLTAFAQDTNTPAPQADFAAGEAVDVVLPPADVAVPVLYAYATLGKQQTAARMCWQVLVPERDIKIREHTAKPWLLRNLVPITGAVMGGAVGGLLLRQHATSQMVIRHWALPVVAAGATAGYFAGPGGVTGFVVGAAIGEKLGKRKLPITLGSGAAGALIGIKAWNFLFPPDVPDAPQADPEGDIDVEVFVRDEVCGTGVQTAYTQSLYRVAYRYNGEERFADLAYDPGEALLINAAGTVTGPARIRLD